MSFSNDPQIPGALDSSADDTLAACQLEIELAWNERRDDSVVHRLAAMHPQLADDLYDFFADVIEAEDGLDQERPERRLMDARVREMIRRRSETRPQPRSFLKIVRDVTDEDLEAVAATMEVPLDFLVDVSDHGDVLPMAARREFLRRALGVIGMGEISEDEVLGSFDVKSLRRAASRSGPYTPENLTYEKLVKRSSLSAERKAFWVEVGRG